MSRPLFLRIVNEVEQYDSYFIQITYAIEVLGLSSLQKTLQGSELLVGVTDPDQK